MWWEKTVEYLFIIDAYRSGQCMFAAPLAGTHEHTAGDAILGKADRFILVEFKRRAKDIPTEESLFKNYAEARKQLSGYNHHFFVYGKTATTSTTDTSNSSPDAFTLGARRYFNAEPVSQSISIEDIEAHLKGKPLNADSIDDALEILEKGVDKKHFDEYLIKLAALKHVDKRSGGHVSPEQMSTVVGITNGKVVSTQMLYEFAPKYFPSPTKRIAFDLSAENTLK